MNMTGRIAYGADGYYLIVAAGTSAFMGLLVCDRNFGSINGHVIREIPVKTVRRTVTLNAFMQDLVAEVAELISQGDLKRAEVLAGNAVNMYELVNN